MAMRETNTNPDSAQTRDRLVNAAERRFSEQGFRNASVRDITREASCNIAAVNYHFGGKNNLYRDVFLRRLREVRQRRLAALDAAVAGGEPIELEALLRAFASGFVEPMVEDDAGRRWMLLVSYEMVDPQLPPETFHTEMLLPLQRALGAAMVRALPGLPRAEAELSAHSFIAQLVHVVKLERCLIGDRGEGWSLGELVDHSIRFTAAALRALPARAA
jgi:AcrR family transcriptional regulator